MTVPREPPSPRTIQFAVGYERDREIKDGHVDSEAIRKLSPNGWNLIHYIKERFEFGAIHVITGLTERLTSSNALSTFIIYIQIVS